MPRVISQLSYILYLIHRAFLVHLALYVSLTEVRSNMAFYPYVGKRVSLSTFLNIYHHPAMGPKIPTFIYKKKRLACLDINIRML
jgi:hypothetical protein